jgi:hypothetical protein
MSGLATILPRLGTTGDSQSGKTLWSVAVERVTFNQRQRKMGYGKCLGDPRKSFELSVRRPGAADAAAIETAPAERTGLNPASSAGAVQIET